jgi:hypothetical protein
LLKAEQIVDSFHRKSNNKSFQVYSVVSPYRNRVPSSVWVSETDAEVSSILAKRVVFMRKKVEVSRREVAPTTRQYRKFS